MGYVRIISSKVKRAAELISKFNIIIKYFKKISNKDIPEIEKSY